jgi:tetratricopeptide (TPR) repeat protein
MDRRRRAAAEPALRAAVVLYEETRPADEPSRRDLAQQSARCRLRLGALLADLGRLAEAEEAYRGSLLDYEAAAGSGPERTAVGRERGLAEQRLGALLEASGRGGEAESLYRAARDRLGRLAEEAPGDAILRREWAESTGRLVELLARSGRHDEAEATARAGVETLRRAAADFPDRPEVRTDLAAGLARRAVVRLRREGPADQAAAEEARALVAEAIRVCPDEAEALNHVGWALARDPAPGACIAQAAVELGQRAVARNEGGGYIWNTLGIAHYRAGDAAAAVEALGRAVALMGDESLAHNALFLAQAHARLGQSDEARRWYDRAASWMEANPAFDAELLRFRAEAEATLRGDPW